MPNYNFACHACERVWDSIVPFEEKWLICTCGAKVERKFPIEALNGMQIMESYFDEGLGVDIHGKRHRAEVMRGMGLVEAGDPIGGARSFDSSLGMTEGEKPKPVGREYRGSREDEAKDFEVEVHRGEDRTSGERVKWSELENGVKPVNKEKADEALNDFVKGVNDARRNNR